MSVRPFPALLCGLTLLGALAASPQAIHGQQPRADSASKHLEGVMVRVRQAPSVVGAAATVTVSADSLRTAPGATLDQALRTVPFVGVRTNSRGETELSVRASDSRTPALLLDGAPLSAGWDGRADASLVPLSGAVGLRITRSVPSLLAGPNIFAGVVEVSLAGPVTEPRGVVAAGGDAAGGVTSRVLGSRATALGGGRLSLSAGGGHRQRDWVPTPSGFSDQSRTAGRRLNSDLRQTDVFAAAHWGNGSGRFVSASATGARGARGVMPEAHLLAPRFWRMPTADRAIGILAAGTGAVSTPLGTGSLEARVSLNAGRTHIDQYRDASYSRLSGTERGDDRTTAVRVTGEHSLGARGDVGLGLTMTQVDYTEALGNGSAVASQLRYRQRLFSVGAETDWEVGARTSVQVAAAVDGAETPRAGDKPALDRLDAFAGRMGVTRRIGDGTTRLTAAAISRARFPALRELYSGALGRFVPNPSLRPERFTGVEGGATGGTGTWQWQVMGFHQRTDDVVIRVTRPNRQQQRVNRDAQLASGAELLLGWTGRRASVLADLTRQEVRVLDPTQPTGRRPAEYQPRVRGSVTAIAPLAAGVRGLAAVVATGRQACLNAETGRYDGIAPSTRVDLQVDRDVRVRRGGVLSLLRVLVAVDNATDAALYDQCGLPQPGRLARLGFELR